MNQTLSLPLRHSWAEINTSAIEHNARRLKELIGPEVELMAMVKANAYGHGAVESAKAAVRGGATWLGVYTAGEALELRSAGIKARILVLGPTAEEWVRPAFENDITLAVPSADSGRMMARAARTLGKPARVHVKVDTGMTRLGVGVGEAAGLVRELTEDGAIEVDGLYTHFAVADNPDARETPGWGRSFTRRQLEMYKGLIAQVDQQGSAVRYRHAANSPATLSYQETRFNLVRTGILLYGLHPSPQVPRPEGFRPALTLKTRLALVRDAPRGTFVSYGCTYETQRDSRIGVMTIGYADGFRRAPRNYGEVLVRGRRAPVVGRVCMDQSMIDVTDIPGARGGDEVVIIGNQGENEISAEEVAERAGTINYEVVTTISTRVPRIYISD